MEPSDPDLNSSRKKKNLTIIIFKYWILLFIFSISVTNCDSVNCFLLQAFFSLALRVIAWFLTVNQVFLKRFFHVS